MKRFESGVKWNHWRIGAHRSLLKLSPPSTARTIVRAYNSRKSFFKFLSPLCRAGPAPTFPTPAASLPRKAFGTAWMLPTGARNPDPSWIIQVFLGPPPTLIATTTPILGSASLRTGPKGEGRAEEDRTLRRASLKPVASTFPNRTQGMRLKDCASILREDLPAHMKAFRMEAFGICTASPITHRDPPVWAAGIFQTLAHSAYSPVHGASAHTRPVQIQGRRAG